MNRVRTSTAICAIAAFVVAACSSGATASPSSGTADASDAVVESSNAPLITIAPSLPTQTDTAWGRIWDDVPDSLIAPSGAEPATDTGEGPASAQLVVTSDAAGVADFYVAGLHGSGWTVTKDGPLEDGSIVVNATKDAGCKAQVKIKSIGDASIVAILYGAACPFE